MSCKMAKTQKDIIRNLKAFKEVTCDLEEESDLLKEKKIILYVATLLENEDTQILSLCLDILDKFVSNESCRSFILSTFGVYEALESLSIRIRNKNEIIHNRVSDMTEILRNYAPPAYNTRNRMKSNKVAQRHHLYLLFMEDLEKDNQGLLEKTLLKIKGIISFLIDIELKRCTIRICPKLTIRQVIERIYQKSGLKAVVVTKNCQEQKEVHYDILQQNVEKSYLEYPEEDDCPKGKAITTATNFVKNSNSFLKSVSNFLNESFYW